MILHHFLTPLGIEQGHSFDTSFDTNKPPGGRPTDVRGWRVTLCLELHPWSLSACPVGSILVPNLHSGIHPCSTLSGKSRHCQLESVAQSSVRKLNPLGTMPGVRDQNSLPKPMQALVDAMKQQGVIADGERVTKTHILSAPLDLRQKAFSNLSYQLGKHSLRKSPSTSSAIQN